MQTENVNFDKIFKGYIGFLEGTGKSRLTINSYKGDLSVFRKFLEEQKLEFKNLTPKDFENYYHYLIRQGMKVNTRRRKLITARSLCHYALTRKKISLSPAEFIKPPERLERLPWIPKREEYKKFLEQFSGSTELSLRNRLVVELLTETALSISELCELRWAHIRGKILEVPGKRKRSLELSKPILLRLKAWHIKQNGKFIFPGFNRYGRMSEKMTPRGLELLFKNVAKRAGLPDLKPKTLRHFSILEWVKSGMHDKEIQRRLGVSSGYSIHAYRKYYKV